MTSHGTRDCDPKFIASLSLIAIKLTLVIEGTFWISYLNTTDNSSDYHHRQCMPFGLLSPTNNKGV